MSQCRPYPVLGHLETPPRVPVADPECARGGGESHILAEKRGVSYTLLKKCMKMQYFHQ